MLRIFVYLFMFLPTMAIAAEFVEGKDYQLVPSAQIVVSTNNTPVVTEFFSYGCPSCYRIEPPLNLWTDKIGKSAKVNKVPVVFKPEWELYAKAYYTAKTLALTEKLSPILFKTIQVDKTPLTTHQAMIQFFVTQGVDKEVATSAFENSPTIEMNVKNGMNLMAQYQINAVPAFVLNNKYKTDLQMAGNPERLFQIMDYLLKKPA